MRKTKFIKEQTDINEKDQRYYIFLALLKTLSSSELCKVLDLSFEQNYIKRNAIVRELKKDMDNNFISSHKKLILELMEILKNGSQRNLSGKVLNDLYKVIPIKCQNKVLNLLLSSNLVSNRNRAYNRLFEEWDSNLENRIIKLWKKFDDIKSTRLLIEYAQINFINNNFNLLLEKVNSKYKRKLYLRMSKINPAVIEDIKKEDKITYAYMLVKNNKKLTKEQALSIYEEYKNDDRISLLYWCLGRMNLWDVLIEIDNKLVERSNCV